MNQNLFTSDFKVKNRKHPAMERVKDAFSNRDVTEDWSRTRRS